MTYLIQMIVPLITEIRIVNCNYRELQKLKKEVEANSKAKILISPISLEKVK